MLGYHRCLLAWVFWMDSHLDWLVEHSTMLNGKDPVKGLVAKASDHQELDVSD